MKNLLMFLFLLTAVKAPASDGGINIREYRDMLSASLGKAEAAEHFYRSTRSFSEQSAPLLLGYKAMAELLRCNHVQNPLNKLSHFNNGRRLLQQAISRDPDDAELRYFRFSTQANTPAWLNYRQHLSTDKEFLISYLAAKQADQAKDTDLCGRIKALLLNSPYCSGTDKQLIKSL